MQDDKTTCYRGLPWIVHYASEVAQFGFPSQLYADLACTCVNLHDHLLGFLSKLEMDTGLEQKT